MSANRENLSPRATRRKLFWQQHIADIAERTDFCSGLVCGTTKHDDRNSPPSPMPTPNASDAFLRGFKIGREARDWRPA